MSNDDEIDAMKKIAAALEPLDSAARHRALQWAASRFRAARSPEDIPAGGTRSLDVKEEADAGTSPFAAFADLFEAANPSMEKDKALVAAYWFQVCMNQASFVAQDLNAELKHLGHRIVNITEALSQLRDDRPALVLQLKKSGTSKQARKTYKLTQEGMKRIQQMMQGGPS